MDLKPAIFQSIFGTLWENLPSVMRKHYANRAFSSDKVIAEGIMKVEVSTLAKLLALFMRMAGALVPYEGNNIPVIVNFDSEQQSNVFCLNRVFNFPGKNPYHFSSRMIPIGGNEVIEFTRSGIGWHASYEFDGQKILIRHLGYKLKLFGKILRLPLEIILGKGYAEEEALSDDSFRMYMDIRHVLFGKIYSYSGEFKILQVNLND